ncbi:MAG TPA: class I SAM-dependent methyltransferase [Burkholderiaceae bacterium]
MQNQSRHVDTKDGAAVYSPAVLKLYDWWVLGISNRYAWGCPTRSVLLPFYRRHLSGDHLDVGVGTGFYPAHGGMPATQKISLLDLNRNSLAAACARIAHLHPVAIEDDVLHPSGALGARQYDSISLFYLLHCLPGSMEEKAAVFALLSRHLTKNGVLYGATILGDEAGHNWFGGKLMKVYNKKGIFGNAGDTLEGLKSALGRHFAETTVERHGKVALFTARLGA